MHTTIQKFGVGKIILMFLKEVSYAYQGCIYLIKNTVKTVTLWNTITIYYSIAVFYFNI